MLPALTGAPIAWAFAYWGGDYWVFLMRNGEGTSTVFQIDGSNGSIRGQTMLDSRIIVGAGVSTCAPSVIL